MHVGEKHAAKVATGVHRDACAQRQRNQRQAQLHLRGQQHPAAQLPYQACVVQGDTMVNEFGTEVWQQQGSQRLPTLAGQYQRKAPAVRP